MKSIVMVAGAVLLLSGCLLKQNSPSNVVSNGKAVNAVGMVRVEELSGATSTTTIEAVFAEAKSQRAPRAIRDLDSLAGGLNAIRVRAPACNAYKINKSRETTKLISVGKLFFGPAFQETMTEIPENADHNYKSQLKGALPSNIYAVKGAGSELVPTFTAALAFPVSLEEVSVTSETMTEDDLTLSKDAALKLEWAAPVVPHSGHVMLMELYSDQPNETYLIRCIGMESAFGLDGAKRTWNIPSSYMTLMPPTNEGLLFLSRVIAMPAVFPTLQVESQGFQTHVTKFILQ